MKKLFAILLVIVLCFALCSCQSDAAKAADEAIKAIGTVTLESKGLIENAEQLVDALSEEDYKSLKNISALTEAKQKLEVLTIEDLIDSIKTVSLSSGNAIGKARAAYNAADESVKSAVSNIATLETAEKTYSDLKQKEQDEKDQTSAAAVIKLIDAIGDVSIDSSGAIKAAENAYKALNSNAKSKVTNYSVLTAAQASYKEALNKQYDAAMSRMTIDKDDINSVTFYTPKRMPKYINDRCAFLPYIGLNKSSNWMLIRYNYAGDDWVFFKSVIIAVDDSRYNKSFRYFDITHDNGGGWVGEYIDDTAKDADIAMLRKIVTSGKTTIRFVGDDYYHDYTLNAADISAIKDVLIVYDYLNTK